jgi:hypothetical protein
VKNAAQGSPAYEKPEIVDSFDSLEVVGDASGVPTGIVVVGNGSALVGVQA